MPNLIDVQRASYEAFLQMEVAPDRRTHTGLQEVFKFVFPIDDFAGRGRLEFVQYELEEPKYDVEECIQRGLTFAAPLKVRLRSDRVGRRRGHRRPLRPRHQGAGRLHGRHAAHDGQRHLHHQRHRARHRLARCTARPGVFFDHDKGKTHSRASTCSPRASSPIAARGSTSSSTPRTSATSASTASASCRPRRCCWRWTATRTEGLRAERAARARARAGRDPRHGSPRRS